MGLVQSCGDDELETLSRNSAVTAASLPAWRESFLAGGEASPKVRHENLGDGNGWRMKSVSAELAMANELPRNRIRQLQNANRSLKWSSCAGSQGQSPSTGRKDGRACVSAVWGQSRSTFYARESTATRGAATARSEDAVNRCQPAGADPRHPGVFALLRRGAS